MKMRGIGIAFWITNATNTHSEFETFIVFQQNSLQERASLLRYTYVAPLFFTSRWKQLLCVLLGILLQSC